jgi:YHS domain-containing protein/FtsZ-binding cell division protein ZapB
MTTNPELIQRIDAEFFAAEKRLNEFRAQQVQEFQKRQERLEQFERTLDELRKVWEPRLDALAEKFGDRVDVHPHIEPGRRSATFEFRSGLASVKLRLSVAPDAEVRKLVFTYDVEILPILMKFDSHVELEQPLDGVNSAKLAAWLDDRIVDFVRTYLALHENHYYLQDHMVEDPVAKVQFPKFAAAATLEHYGKTLYFIDESTLREFEKRISPAQSSTEGSDANR